MNQIENAPAIQTPSIAELQERTLVCIPCYNSHQTIVEVVESVLDYSDADVLLIDDHSEPSVWEVLPRELREEPRVCVHRPRNKVYSGGGKNLGLRQCLLQGYRFALLMDSDVVVHQQTLPRLIDYLRENSAQVIVGAAILPYGNAAQFSDTLINFSKYLPQPSEEVAWKDCLAGYALAIDMDVFRQAPCEFPNSIGGDDVVFCQRLQQNFGIDQFPLLNSACVTHKPPRTTLSKAVRAQTRYGTSFFSHVADRKNLLFRKLPVLHLLTPRLLLMVVRLLRSRRLTDLRYVPICWYLDLRRAIHILRLASTGFVYPKG